MTTDTNQTEPNPPTIDLPAILASHATWLRGDGGAKADLSSADLRFADLSSADLHGADLTGAYLHGADLHGADLTGANLNNAATIYGWGLRRSRA